MIGMEKLEGRLLEFCVLDDPRLMIEVMIETDIRDLIPDSPHSEKTPDLLAIWQRMKALYNEISLIVDKRSILIAIGDAFATLANPLQLREIIKLPSVLAVKCVQK